MYSIGTMLSCMQFLRSLNEEPISVNNFSKQEFYVYTTPANVEKILSSSSCMVKNNGLWYITDKGKGFLVEENLFSSTMNESVKHCMRNLLKESLMNTKPHWIKHVYKGRLECLQRIKEPQEKRDMAVLLQELELLRETTHKAVGWWEELVRFFSPNDDQKTETGKKGESLSREYEYSRVGEYPHWESMFSNLSGFDLLSKVSKGNNDKLHIEVKSSEKSFVFYLTRGEWKKALECEHYLFHFWYLPKKELYLFSPEDIKGHVSINQGNGEWTVCEISLSEEEIKKFYEESAASFVS